MPPTSIEGAVFSAAIYNVLPSVDEADCIKKSFRDFPDVLNAFQSISAKYGLENEMSLRLLHRQFWMPDGSTICEFPTTRDDDGEPALASRVVAETPPDAFPASWIFV
eukprot:TRINITY_DN22604_c0_g1_i1.p2 TRINITY_DN22604_c0_g1~~TRINITY_DN22604_c0_g1_i1.p2  ORF type:complete len:108 (+),score=19.40 TRINITY_DN22604_c0_g1_i1:168-491(+)